MKVNFGSRLIVNDDPAEFQKQLNAACKELGLSGIQPEISYAFGSFGPSFSALLTWTEQA
jgi:hypothetical protein